MSVNLFSAGLWVVGVLGASNLDISTPLGTVKGKLEDDVRVWKSIPYAEPPVRLAPPVKKKAWSTPLDATKELVYCMQTEEDGRMLADMSEDCLRLNVFAPKENATGLPVFVYIHGGGFTNGGGREWTGAPFAKDGIIMVSINYRLGALGFLALQEIQDTYNTTGGANGILDQITALQWVQDNIQSFGGDPDKVTVGGESAGALSVCILNSSPKAKGLFKKAAIFSGSCNGVWGPGTEAEIAMENGLHLIKSLEMPQNTLEELRKQDAIKFIALVGPGVTVDNMVLSKKLFGEAVTVSHAEEGIMIGNTNLDGLIPFLYGQKIDTPFGKVSILPDQAIGLNTFSTRLMTSNIDFATTAGLKRAYQTRLGVTAFKDKDVPAAYAMFNSDICLTCAARTFAKEVAMMNKGPVYVYEYGKSAGGTAYADAGKDKEFAMHAEDLVYTFGLNKSFPAPFGPWNVTDTIFYGVWQGYIFSFIKSTGTGSPLLSGTKEWPAYTTATPKYLFAGKTIEVISADLHPEACNLIDSLSLETRFRNCWMDNLDFEGRLTCKVYKCKAGSLIKDAGTTFAYDEASCCEPATATTTTEGNTTDTTGAATATTAGSTTDTTGAATAGDTTDTTGANTTDTTGANTTDTTGAADTADTTAGKEDTSFASTVLPGFTALAAALF